MVQHADGLVIIIRVRAYAPPLPLAGTAAGERLCRHPLSVNIPTPAHGIRPQAYPVGGNAMCHPLFFQAICQVGKPAPARRQKRDCLTNPF